MSKGKIKYGFGLPWRRTISAMSVGAILLFLGSCSAYVEYVDKNGNNDILVYEDSLITIQRSTEKLGDEILVSHIVRKKDNFSRREYSISNISDHIPFLKARDSFAFSYNVTEQRYKSFSDIPVIAKSFENYTSFQIVNYFPIEKFEDKEFSIYFKLEVNINGTIHTFYRNDTVFKASHYRLVNLR